MSTVAIVPAAGASRRMGRDKLLLPWGDTVVLGALLRSLREGGADRCVVVRSPTNRALADWLERTSCESVVNPQPERGMLSSVRAGLELLGDLNSEVGDSVVVICPGDLPAIRPASVGAVIGCVARGAQLAVPSFEGRRGHPLALSSELAAEIGQLDPSVGLRQLLDRRASDLVEVAVTDQGILRDLDTPEEYRRAVPPAT